MLSGSEKIWGAQMTAQIAWYAPIVNTLVKTVREKQTPALAAKTSSADP